MAFARYKGEAEKTLLSAGFPRIYIFRPACIYPVEPRKEPNLSYRLLRELYPASGTRLSYVKRTSVLSPLFDTSKMTLCRSTRFCFL
jgi:hypothetical protein